MNSEYPDENAASTIFFLTMFGITITASHRQINKRVGVVPEILQGGNMFDTAGPFITKKNTLSVRLGTIS